MPGLPKKRKDLNTVSPDGVQYSGGTTHGEVDVFNHAISVYQQGSQIGPASSNDSVPRPRSIKIGIYSMDCWYTSVYPEQFASLEKLYLCEFCLCQKRVQSDLKAHLSRCELRHPPGLEIYRKDCISVFEVKGSASQMYCQRLCMLAKLFLDHKVVYADVQHFLFYVLTVYDSQGYHFVGYFSKENRHNENLSCIVVLPPYRNKKYGCFLIDFSYLLSKTEGKAGTPEKPLSIAGESCYMQYWRYSFMDYIITNTNSKDVDEHKPTICEFSRISAICVGDIAKIMAKPGGKFFSSFEGGSLVLTIDWNVLFAYMELESDENVPQLDGTALTWTPVDGKAATYPRKCKDCPQVKVRQPPVPQTRRRAPPRRGRRRR